jgi:prepilin-type N-terminal cleavage/methylation domain-containing protein
MRKRRPTLRADHGMTLIEVLAAMFILAVGLAGVMTLLNGANKTTALNNQRTGALNLAREVFEAARSVDYDLITPAQAQAALQAKPGLSGGTPWTIERGSVTYTIRLNVCTFDDPKDGLANGTTVPAPANPCPAATAVTGAPKEANPDDFRRVDVFVDWKNAGATKTMQQTDLIVNPSGGLGPRITTITEPSAQITSGSTVSVPVTTTNAASVHWTIDAAGVEGDAAGGPTSWTAGWDIGMLGTASEVVDGTYQLSAQPFDSRGVPGDTRTATIPVNRSVPRAPTGLRGGRNQAFTQTAVDLEWSANVERDVLGYRVYRTDGAATKLVCGKPNEPLNATSCTDDNAPATGTIEYRVYAVDLVDLASSNSAQREGAASTVLTLTGTGTQPVAPTNLAVSIVNGLASLTWTAPASGAPAFYRIYRDGQLLANRIARTATNDPFYTDTTWGGVTHTYRVSAVSSAYNESPLSNAANTP